MTVARLQLILALIFLLLGGWCLLFPGMVIGLTILPELPEATDQARFLMGCFGVATLFKVTSYIVGDENIPGLVQIHREVVGVHRPPWTLVVVQALGHRHYKVEIDVVAAG